MRLAAFDSTVFSIMSVSEIRLRSRSLQLTTIALWFTARFLFIFFILFFYYRSICIIDNGASKHRTRNARFRARRADHSTTSIGLESQGSV